MTPPPLRPGTVTPVALSRLAALLELPAPPGPDVAITGITHDSRQVRPGDLYAAMLGENAHGASFARQAAAAGAAAILTDPLGRERAGLSELPVLVTQNARAVLGRLAAQIYGNPAAELLTLGVTGTNGKTTTAFLMESGLRAAGHRAGLLGTVATRIGEETIPSARTTPEAPELHALLAVMRERGADAVSMEVSSHALDMHRVDGVVFSAALFTNLSQDHLDYHFTLEAYFAAKAVLFTPEHAKLGVLNLDDEHGTRLVELSQVPVLTYSASGRADADWRAVDVLAQSDGSRFTVVGPDGARGDGSVALPGGFNVANALGAVVTLVATGVPLENALSGVAACPGVPGRMERVDVGQPYLAVVDYAHSPDAVSTLLAALRPVTTGKLIVVLGAGGDRDRGKRPLMGQAAARGADVVVLTDDNPRSEDPREILAAVRAGADAVPARALHIEHDRAAAMALAVSLAQPGDTVVVAGKGHEQGQEAAGVVRPFDDRSVLAEAIRGGRRMIALRLAEIAAACGGTVHDGAPEDLVDGPVVVDSRLVSPGALFVAVPGERADGHDFAAAAVAAGAAAVLATRPVGVPAVVVTDTVEALGRLAGLVVSRLAAEHDLVVVGITGSQGKTSTKDLIAAVLEARGETVAPPGSFNNEIGLPLTALRAGPSTRHLVLEMGSRGIGHVRYLCEIAPPRIGVVLNVGVAHVGEFGSRDAIAVAKGELVEALPPSGTAVLNADDPLVVGMAPRTRARLLTFGVSAASGADVTAEQVTLDAGRARFVLLTPAGQAPVALQVHGLHQVGNALAAAAVGHEVGMSAEQIAAALGAATPRSRWRMEVSTRADGLTVVNDAYNANPDSMKAALAATVAIAGDRRRWAVLGEMRELGESSAVEHEALGRLVADMEISRLIVVGEGARATLTGALRARTWADEPAFVPDADAALAILRAELTNTDVVLVKASRAVGLERIAAGLLEEGT